MEAQKRVGSEGQMKHWAVGSFPLAMRQMAPSDTFEHEGAAWKGVGWAGGEVEHEHHTVKTGHEVCQNLVGDAANGA